jgi:hypothetical protein
MFIRPIPACRRMRTSKAFFRAAQKLFHRQARRIGGDISTSARETIKDCHGLTTRTG